MTLLSEHGIRGGRKPFKAGCFRLAFWFCVCGLALQAQPDHLTVTSSTPPPYQANIDITTSGTVVINNGASVTYQAGSRINLEPGFHASTGSAFHAQIGVPAGGGGGSSQPVSASVSPSSGPGPTTFTFVTSNDTNVDSVYILINGTLDGTDACYILYSKTANAIYLRDDPSIEWMGGFAPQTQQTIPNNQCSLNVGSSTVSHGTNLTINLSLSFNPSFNGVQNAFMEVFDTSEGVSGYYQMPIGYTAYAANPQPPSGSVTPSSGSASGQIFTFHAASVNGYRYLSQETILFSTSPSTTGCSLIYLRGPNVLYLVGDNGAGWVDPPLTPGVHGAVSNSECTVDSGGSAVASTNSLDLPVYIQFNPAFGGAKTIYQALYDHTGQTQGWQPVGTWTLPAAPPPPLSITTSSLPGGTVGQTYSSVTLAATGGTGSSYTFFSTSLPPGLSVSAGVLQGSPTQPGTYNDVVIQVSDGVSLAQKSFAITIAPGPLTMQTTSLPSGTAGTWYQQQLVATGGYPNYVWTVTGLPSGLTATAGGLISGYPADHGNLGYPTSVTIQVRDALNHLAPASPLPLTLYIYAGQLQLTTPGPSLPSATVGAQYSFTFTSIGGGQAPGWSLINWWPGPTIGLDFDHLAPTSGVFQGTPTTAGDYSLFVQASTGSSVSNFTYTLSVKPAPATNPTVTCSASPASIAFGGGPVTFTAMPSPGTPPYTYSWSAPVSQGPSALTTLTFTPAAAQVYTAVVGITDAAGRSNSNSCSVNVTPRTGAASLTSPTPGNPLAGNSVIFQWNTGIAVSQYWLSVGTDSNATDILNNAGQSRNLFSNPIPLPTNSCNTIYVKLTSDPGGIMQTQSYQFSRSCSQPKEYIRIGGRVIAIENH